MSVRTVQFEQVAIHRAMGISHGQGWSLDALSPGVNLIHGPNGSGKTTTALVLQALLWPDSGILPRPTISGRFRDDGKVWEVEVDAGHATIREDGEPTTPPQLGAVENRLRYWIALHELIQAKDAAFAKMIVQASLGGYDLDDAAKVLGFSGNVSSPRKVKQAVTTAVGDVETACRKQQQVQRDAEQLNQLKKERQQAVDAHSELHRLHRAIVYCDANEQRDQLQAQLDAFPAGVAKLHGDERQALDHLDNARGRLERTRGSLHDDIRDAKTTLDAVQLPQEGVAAADLRRARAVRAELGPLENEIAQHHNVERQANAEAVAARSRLGDQVTDDQLQAAGPAEVGELSEFARAVFAFHAQEQHLEDRRQQLGQPEPEDIRGRELSQLTDGVRSLSEWLAGPAASATRRRWPWWLTAACLIIVILATALAIVDHPLWLLAGLIGPGLLLARWMAFGSSPADARSVHRISYERTNLPSPEAWTACDVVQRLLMLCQWLVQRERADDCRRRLAELENEGKQLTEKRDNLDHLRGELQERFGLEVKMEDTWLPVLVDNLSRWQQQQGTVSGAAATRERKERELEWKLEELNLMIRAYGDADVNNAAQADEAVNDLADRKRGHEDARRKLAAAQRRLDEEIEPQLESNAEDRQQLFKRLAISEAETARIDDWLVLRPQFLDVQRRLNEQEVRRNQIAQDLQGRAELLDLDRVELDERVKEQQRIAERRESLGEQIGGIERAIGDAKSGHELSTALEDHDAALAALADARDENRAAVAGHVLSEWLRKEVVEPSRPDVYRRADELLIRITNGMLRLDVDDRDREPAFRARYGDQPSRPVEQLSIGERVQLLVAVRLAFMEQDEAARLPLLLDEALGTSDDERAKAIIDSVIAVAREGRQVFYFTAQTDEVGKWLPRLNEAGIPYRCIDLLAERGLAVSKQQPLTIAEVARPVVPAPDGRSRADYAKALGVPGFNPRNETQEHLHLWHVIHDLDVLHHLLEHGIREWGQLRTLLDHDADGISENAGELDRARARTVAIETACEAWRVGRGRPVDRAALEDSDCVTEKFIDELTELTAQRDGDAAALITALEQNEIRYWRADNTEKLREYFIEQGYLPQDEPLNRETITNRAVAAVANAALAGHIGTAWVDEIVASLPD